MIERSYDLVIIGATAAGLSLAIEAGESGVERVMILEAGADLVVPDLIGQHALEVHFQERVRAVRSTANGAAVETETGVYSATAVVLADHILSTEARVPLSVAETVESRVHIGSVPSDPRDADILVVGGGELAIEWSMHLARSGAGVVLAAGQMNLDDRSRVGRTILQRLEAERLATILWRSTPVEIADAEGLPMAYFDDRRTPDLQFDHVVWVGDGDPDPADPADGSADASVWYLTDRATVVSGAMAVASPGRIWQRLRAARFPDAPSVVEPPREWRQGDRQRIEELRTLHYNAEITHFERAHSDLWVLRVRPDHGDTSHLPGQYASLGLGYWEERADNALDPDLDARWQKLIRRSYSISSRIFDPDGYLTNPAHADELEFYIVLVPPTVDNVPALTPRLALKRPGDRVYLGPKVAGRYTLAPVTDPEATVVLLSTGTGEAPHNAMVLELLRKGHRGPITSAVSVRQESDLGYLESHRTLESHFGNYHYLPLPTREPGIPKRYIQHVIEDGTLDDLVGGLDPERTHVYLCGNPAMIGLPEDGEFPEPAGVVELLAARGFTLDRRGERGNVHYEEYW